MAQPTERPQQVPAGTRITVRCDEELCWIDDITVVSNGQPITGQPSCPGCHGPVRPVSHVLPTWEE